MTYSQQEVRAAWNVEYMDWMLDGGSQAFRAELFDQAEYRAERQRAGLPVREEPLLK